MSENYLMKLYKRINQWPLGDRIFSFVACRKAPYFATIKPKITKLEPGECHCFIKKRRSVENHIKTVHVIAICNGLEMAMGFMAEASIPKHLRWIPKGMTVDYTAKAGSDIRCVAVLPDNAWAPGDLLVDVTAYDENDIVVVKGTIKLWISEKKR